MGGRRGLAGLSGVHTHMSNTRNTPVEAIEHYLPVRIRQYASARATAAARARAPGGEGIVREYEMLTDTSVTVLSDRRRRPPYGARGRRARRRRAATRSIRDGEETDAAGQGRSSQLRAGDRLRIETPGGGGYGMPAAEASERGCVDVRLPDLRLVARRRRRRRGARSSRPSLGWMLDAFDVMLYALVLPTLMRATRRIDATTSRARCSR